MKTYNINRTILCAGMSLLMLTCSNNLFAQDAAEDDTATEKAPVKRGNNLPVYKMKEISGYIFDAATKTPMDGVHVEAFGNKRYATITDENGKYTLKVPVFVTSMYVSAPEYNDVRVAIDKDVTPDTYLYSDKFNSAYNPETNITASNKVSIENTTSISIDEEIDNKLSGDIHTTSRTGIRGQGLEMYIRGINSININAQPLVIVDGMYIDMQLDRTTIHDGFVNNILAGFDPEDIESIEVLKNATALYGARGANGVIIINTRRGHSQATKINVCLNAGFETIPSTLPMMNASQYRTYVSDLIGTTETGIEYPNLTVPFLNSNENYYWYPMYHNENNWSDGLYRNAATQNYKVNVQGGDDVAMYNLSLGYANSASTAKKNDFDRLNIRFNTDINLIPGVSTQLDLSYSKTTYSLRDNGWAESYSNSTISSPNVLGLIQAPFLSKYNYYTGEDGKLHESVVYSGKFYDDANYPFGYAYNYGTNTELANPYWILENADGVNKNRQEMTQFFLNVKPKWEINSHLTVSDQFAYQLVRTNEKYYLPEAGVPEYVLEGFGAVKSEVRSLFSNETAIMNDFRVEWNNRYGMHNVRAFGGFRYTNNSFADSFMKGYNTGNDKDPDMKNSLDFRDSDGNQDAWRNMSYYAVGKYNIKDTYYLEGTVTAETSSRFGRNTEDGIKMFGVKWGIFPSLQAGWVITNEDWMPKLKGINYLKFTAGYDISGNDNIDYALASTYFQSNTFLGQAIGLELVNIENPSIQWETTRSWNFGLNGSFLNNRIQAGVDLYVRNTSNLVTYKTVNYLSGLRGYYTNGGSLRNVGADIKVNAILLNTKDFKLQAGASLGHYKNKVTSLPDGDYTTLIYGGEVLTSVGNPVGLFYGYKTNGVFASENEASHATTETADGHLKYPTGVTMNPYKNFSAGDVRFIDSNSDGIIDEKDKGIIGNPNPDIYGTIYTNLAYKHWKLDINFKYSLGNDIYNYQRSRLESGTNFYNQTIAMLNRWTCEGQVTDVPRVMSTESDEWVNNERFSDRWIEDGSYLKLKNVRLSYEWPLNLTWIQGVTVWGEANNIFTISKYTGSDPEFSCSNSILYNGIDAGLLPSNRSFNIGVKINL